MKTVFLLSAKLQSGKNQLATFLTDAMVASGLKVSTESYARALKSGCTQDFTKLWEFLEKERESLMCVHNVPDYAISWMSVKPENLQEDKTDLTRLLLQIYGTEIFRNRVDSDYWVKKCIASISASDSDVIMITDVRFPNEVNAMLDWAEEDSSSRRVVTVRIERPGFTRDSSDPVHSHPSETGLDDFGPWDYVVENVGTLEDLKDSALAMLKEAMG